MMETRKPAPRSSTETIACVDGWPLDAGHVRRRLATIRAEAGPANLPAQGSPEDRRLRRWIVQTLVDEALLEGLAVAAGVAPRSCAATPLSDEAVVAAFGRITATTAVDDAEVRDYYERNLHLYRLPETRDALQVIADDRITGLHMLAQARRCGLAEAVATAPVALPSPEWLRFQRGAVGGALEQAVFSTSPDGVVGPIETALGWHVVQIIEVRAASVEPFEAVEQDIRSTLLGTRRGESLDAWLRDQRRDRVILMAGYEPPGDPRTPDPIHRH